jgi:hypothetical protein
MKLHKIVRMQMVLTGLGAALLLASLAYPQRAMDPTRQEVKAGTPQVKQSVAQNTAQSAEPADAAEIDAAAEEDLVPTGFAMEDGLLLLILALGTGSIFVYAKLATRPTRFVRPVLRGRSYGPISGATTH